MGHIFTPGNYGEIVRLIQYIPIVDGKIVGTVDDQFSIEIDDNEVEILFGNKKDSVSFRDITKLFINLLKDERRLMEIFTEQNIIALLGARYPFQYLLFDYCLAALAKDLTDARLYLDHSYFILNLDYSFYVMLSCMLNDNLVKDNDIKEFLALLANAMQPVSAPCHAEKYGKEYKKRYELYVKELDKIEKKK